MECAPASHGFCKNQMCIEEFHQGSHLFSNFIDIKSYQTSTARALVWWFGRLMMVVGGILSYYLGWGCLRQLPSGMAGNWKSCNKYIWRTSKDYWMGRRPSQGTVRVAPPLWYDNWTQPKSVIILAPKLNKRCDFKVFTLNPPRPLSSYKFDRATRQFLRVEKLPLAWDERLERKHVEQCKGCDLRASFGKSESWSHLATDWCLWCMCMCRKYVWSNFLDWLAK